MSEQESLAEMRDALAAGRGSIALVYVFGHGLCAQVKVNTRKVGPLVIPRDDQTLGDVLHMLGDLAVKDVELAS